LQVPKTVRRQDDTAATGGYASGMMSGQAVDERVAIPGGTCSPFASSCRRRRTAGPFLVPNAVETAEQPHRAFVLQALLQGAGGGGSRRRIRASSDFEPGFAPNFSLN